MTPNTVTPNRGRAHAARPAGITLGVLCVAFTATACSPGRTVSAPIPAASSFVVQESSPDAPPTSKARTTSKPRATGQTPVPDPTRPPSTPSSTRPSPPRAPVQPASDTRPGSAPDTRTIEPAPAPEIVLAPGDVGATVRTLQARLRQIGWFTGDVTNTYGPTTAAAVRGFQARRGLDATGAVDRGTWDALRSMTRRPSSDELDNVEPAPTKAKEPKPEGPQADQPQVNEPTRDEAVTPTPKPVPTKPAVPTPEPAPTKPAAPKPPTPAKTTSTTPPKPKPKPTPVVVPPAPVRPAGPRWDVDERCMTGRVICISKTTRTLTWVVDGKAQYQFAVRFGSEAEPTREGTFALYRKKIDVVSNIYHTPMPYSMFFSGGQAVHYSSNFAQLGYNGASHGCVNVRDRAGLVRLYGESRIGDKVVVHW